MHGVGHDEELKYFTENKICEVVLMSDSADDVKS
jgi:hypothetical protein